MHYDNFFVQFQAQLKQISDEIFSKRFDVIITKYKSIFLVITIQDISLKSMMQYKLKSMIIKQVQILTKIFIILFMLSVPAMSSSQQCINYLQKLQNDSKTNTTLFLNQMTPYLILSGKSLDDLGFPGSCLQVDNYAYSTVEVKIVTNSTQFNGFLGFCFTNVCNVDDLNSFADFIIDFIFSEFNQGVSGKFIQPPLELQFSPLALSLCLVFTVIIFITMLAPIMHWISLCKKQRDSQFEIKSVYIDLQNPNQQLQQDRITEQSTLIERLSLKYKWKQLWKSQTTYNILSFSIFRVFAVPLLIYGQIFWLTNYGAYNHYEYFQQIYGSLYVKIAIFAYYIPDIFFFISAFLFTKKVLSFQDDHYTKLFKSLGWKIFRLYPLYIVSLVIYWGISPYLHVGPVWYIYQNQASICNHSWWKVILLIDNWFAQGCYPVLWFVQVEIQFILFISLLFFTVYFKNNRYAYYLLGVYLLTAIILLFVLSAQMIVSIQIAIQPYTELYYKSFYSHILFYLVGVIFAILANKQQIRLAIQTVILDKIILNIVIQISSVGMLILIMLRPWIWWGKTTLELQLSFCRLGTLIGFIGLFLNGMFIHEKNTTLIHKYGYYMYPIILTSYMIVQSSFWSVGSFMYVSGTDILNQMIPNVIISYALGIFLGLCFDTRTIVHSSISNK